MTDGGSELKHRPQEGEVVEKERVSRRAWVGRFVGPVLAVVAYFTLPTGEGALSQGGVATVAVGVLMAVWWITEALPLAVTALLPIALFPVLGAAEIEDATAPYANDLIFLFLGGFLIALAMQRWGLHRRIALLTVLGVGTHPARLIGGFMIATAFISMWVSNTSTTLMMLPIGLSVLGLVMGGEGEELTGWGASNFATALMLAIAYAASIGGLATLIGTPPNLFMAGFLQETYDIQIGFAQWMAVGLPLVVVFLLVAWVVLTRFVYPPEMEEISGGRDIIRDQLSRMGPVSRGERIVLTVFILTALAWISREPLTSAFSFLGGLSDAGIAIIAAIVLFAIPVDTRNGVFALDWRAIQRLPWGVLLLFGGGLSLASAVSENGVDEWIGQQVAALGGVPVVALVVVVTLSILLLTELTSNTATAATFLPIMAGAAVGLNLDPLVLVVPAALAASCAFMMPVATPPNAIVFGSGHVTIAQMVRAGVWLNLIAVVLITLTVYTLAALVLGVG